MVSADRQVATNHTTLKAVPRVDVQGENCLQGHDFLAAACSEGCVNLRQSSISPVAIQKIHSDQHPPGILNLICAFEYKN